MRKIRLIILLNVFVVLLFLIDHFIKYFLIHKLPIEGVYFISPKIPVFIGVFKNPYIAFSMPLALPIIIVITIPILTLLFYFFIKSYRQKNLADNIATSFIIWGAVSNFIDRISLGFVVDYLHISILPIFNIADIMITMGILIYAFTYYKEVEKNI